MNTEQLQLFEEQTIRTAWDEENEEWYFSVVDVISALTEQETQRSASTYWAVLKKRLKAEGADQLLTNCKQPNIKKIYVSLLIHISFVNYLDYFARIEDILWIKDFLDARHELHLSVTDLFFQIFSFGITDAVFP